MKKYLLVVLMALILILPVAGYSDVLLAQGITANDSSSFGATIYVDDDNTEGPWDGTIEHPFQFIQDGIDNASDSDTVFVYNGTYYGNVVVDKSIDLIGENKDTTIIYGLNKGSVIKVKTESVSIENFTLINGTHGVYCDYDKTSISHNIIINNNKGIESSYSENVNITGNIISKNNYGITFYRADDSIIKGNHILSNKKIGILFDLATTPGAGCENNSVSYNIIQKNTMGIYLSDSGNHNINYTNFYQNIVDASFESTRGDDWNHNYWNRPRILPKPIIGTIFYYLPWVNFDWHPASEPYDIN